MQAIERPKVTGGWPSTLTFSPDGRFLVMKAWTHQVLDTAEGKWLAPLRSSDHHNVQFVLGGRSIAYCDYVSAVGVADFATREERRYALPRASARGLVATPDGNTLYLLAHLFDGPRGAEVWRFDAATLERRGEFASQKETPWEMIGSADGRRLATGRIVDNETIRVWDTIDPDRPSVRIRPKVSASQFALSSDGSRLATVGSRGVTLWDAATGREVWASGKHRRGVQMVSFCPGRQLLATGDNAGGIFLWDFAGRVLTRYDFGLGDVYGLTFAPDGLRGAAVDGRRIVIWDVDA